jgi:hypothetical protein
MIIDVFLRIAVLTAAGWVAAVCFRRNAAARHAVWTAVLAGTLFMPLLYSISPRVPLRALPQRAVVATPLADPIDFAPPAINIVAAQSPAHWVIRWQDVATAGYFFGVGVLGVRLLLALRGATG